MKWIMEYIVNGVLLLDKSEACKLLMKSVRYCMVGGNLHKRSFSEPLLRRLDLKAAMKVMAKMHEIFCDNHSKGCSMARQIELQGFYWSTMMKDFERYSREG